MQVLYDLHVRLRFSYGGFSSGVTTALGALARLQQQMTAAGATSAKLHRSLGLLAAGMALTGAGMAGVGVMRGWVTAAGTMQEALAQVGIVAKGTQGQLASLVNQSYTVANQTQFSAPQVLRAESIMGGLNFRDPLGKQTPRQVIGGAIADFMRAAEVAQHFQGTNYEASVKALSQMSHMMGVYSGPVLAKNVALEMGASLASGMSLPEQATALRYLAPAMKTMNLTSRDALALVAVAHQTGLTQGRGASNLGAMLRGLALTGAPRHDRNLLAMEKLAGGNFYNASGQFVGLPETMRLFNQFYRRQNTVFNGRKITPEMVGQFARNALLVQGSQAAAVLGSDTSLRQFNATRAQIGGDTPAWLKGVQNTLNMTLQGQLATLKGNLSSISALLGAPLMGPLGVVVHGFVELTGWVVTLLKTHPQMASFIATFAAVATAAALIAGPLLVAAGAFGILSAAGIVTAGTFLPFTAAVVGVVAAIAGAVWVFTHWGQTLAFLRNPLGALSGQFGVIGQVIAAALIPVGLMVAPFVALGLAIAHVIAWAGGFAGIGRTIGAVFGVIGRTVGGSLATLGGAFSVIGLLAGTLMLALSPLARFVGTVLGAVFKGAGDYLTTTFLRPIQNVVLAVQGAIGWFLTWSKTITIVKDAVGWLGDKMKGFLEFLGVLHRGPAAPPHAVIVGPSVPLGIHALGGTTVGLPLTIPAVHFPPAPHLIGSVPRAKPGQVTHPTSGHAGYVWQDPWAFTPPVHPTPPALTTPRRIGPPAPPLIPHKSGGMALIGAGSIHQTHQTTEVHHHPVSLTMNINGADHATSNDLAAAVAKRVRHEITAQARWHNRYHGKGLLGMEPT